MLEGSSLFLDLDGTLFDLVDDPDQVRADDSLRNLLGGLTNKLAGRLALVSGRSLEQIDAMLGEAAADLAISASHGCEHRWGGVWARPNRPESVAEAVTLMKAFVIGRPGLLVEEKSFGVALHYRMNPGEAEIAHSFAGRLARALDLELQLGKMVVELRVMGADKGRAVHRHMSRQPMRGTRPIFVGDDLTDEPGFAAARELGGHGILIGEAHETEADYRLACPTELRAWLAEQLA